MYVFPLDHFNLESVPPSCFHLTILFSSFRLVFIPSPYLPLLTLPYSHHSALPSDSRTTLMFIPLLARNSSATTASPPTTSDTNTNVTHTSLAHRNLVGILIIAALLALALALSLCFAKWSKPVRRFLRGERRSGGDDLPTLSEAPPPLPTTPTPLLPRPSQGNAADSDVEKAVVISDSSSSQSSFDRDATEIDEGKGKANVGVALPAKVRKMRAPVLRLFYFK
jgi:hypothetical protein